MNDYYDYYSYSSPPAYNPVFTIISLVLCVFVLVCMWIIFRKANKPGWAAIVPFYNLYVMFEITWGSGWRFLLMLIPIYNIILSIQTQIRLAKAFGKGGGFAAGLIFLPYIFIPILAFSGASYQGIPVKAASYQPNQPNNPYQNNPYQNNPYQNNAYGNAPQGSYQQQPYQQPPYAAPQQPYQQPQQPQYTPPQQPQYTAPQPEPQPQPQYTAPQPEPQPQPEARPAAFCPNCGAKLDFDLDGCDCDDCGHDHDEE